MSIWNDKLSVMAKTEVSIITGFTLGITPEQALDARARAWVFTFDCYAKKTARTRGGEDAMKGSKNDRASTT